MPDSPREPDAAHHADSGAEQRSIAGMPRWVKISSVAVLVLVVLVVVMLLVGGGGGPGGHNPGRH